MSKAKQKITTPPMRWVPADKDRPMPEYVDPIHEKAKADGWNRLREILDEAMQDKIIAASSGAVDFLELMHSIVDDHSILTAESNVSAMQPFIGFINSPLKKKNAELLGKLNDNKNKTTTTGRG